MGGVDGQPECVRYWRVEVEHEMGRAVPTIGANQGRVVLHGALVGKPQQRATVVAKRVGHLPL
jgi:hypothetical protein